MRLKILKNLHNKIIIWNKSIEPNILFFWFKIKTPKYSKKKYTNYPNQSKYDSNMVAIFFIKQKSKNEKIKPKPNDIPIEHPQRKYQPWIIKKKYNKA